MRDSHLSRRHFLRASGVCMALPWMETLQPKTSFQNAGETAAPRRFVAIYVPNGIHMEDWTPSSKSALTSEGNKLEEPGFALSPLLETLKDHQGQFSILSGLTQDKARANGDGPGDHARAAAAYLTGAQPKKTKGSDIRVGISADQVAARLIGQQTRLPSLQLGCEGGRQSGQCDSGYPCVYSSNISWASARTPMLHDTHPQSVFDRLFGDGLEHLKPADRREHHQRRRSILDWVRADAKRLGQKLSQRDQYKLSEYLEGVRELERRVELFSNAATSDSETPELARPEATPKDFAEHARLQYQLLATALETDSTRVATFMLANEGSNHVYRNCDAKEGHHTLSHHGKDPDKQATIARINRFHLELFNEFLARLSQSTNGDGEDNGSLLDHTAVLYGSGIADGNRHHHHDLPILLAGGHHIGLPNGSSTNPASTGVHRTYERDTPINNLYASLITALTDTSSETNSQFGDATGLLNLNRSI